MSPSPGLRSCHLRSDVQAWKASLRPAGLASPRWWGAAPAQEGPAPWKHHPSEGVGAQFAGPISRAGSTPWL